MLTSKDLAAKLKTLQEEEDARLAAVKDNVIAIKTVITSACFTEPNDKGEIYCRLTLQDKVPAYTKKGDLIRTNSILLFKHQIMSALSESRRFALYSSKLSYLQKEENGVQVLSRLLAWTTIEIKAIVLEAGDNFVDPLTGYQSDKIVTSPCVRYSIASLDECYNTVNGEVLGTNNDDII